MSGARTVPLHPFTPDSALWHCVLLSGPTLHTWPMALTAKKNWFCGFLTNSLVCETARCAPGGEDYTRVIRKCLPLFACYLYLHKDLVFCWVTSLLCFVELSCGIRWLCLTQRRMTQTGSGTGEATYWQRRRPRRKCWFNCQRLIWDYDLITKYQLSRLRTWV